MKNIKNNKKGFLLLEAVIAITVIILTITITSQILKSETKINNKVSETLLKINSKDVFNKLDYLKSILMEKGKNNFFLNNNEKYAGWNILKITPNETLDELNGDYVLETSSVCSSSSTGLDLCLRKLSNNELGYFKMKGSYSLLEYNGDKLQQKTGTKESLNLDCDKNDLGGNCLAYKISIENLVNSSYRKKSYIRSDGVTVTINANKLIKLKIIGKDQKIIKTYEYLLNTY